MGSAASVPFPEPPHHASDSQDADLPTSHPTRLYRNNQSPACLPSCVTPSLKQSLPVLEYLPVVHLLRSMPRIRSRLTQGRSALPWKPWIFGLKDSHLYLATHSGILSSMQSTAPYGTASSRMQCSSTDPYGSLSFGGTFQPRTFSAQGLSTSELLRTL